MVIAFLGAFPSSSSGIREHWANKPDISIILDILPLRPGHTLLVPKAHYARISELPSEHAAALGKAIPKVSNALTKGALVNLTTLVSWASKLKSEVQLLTILV